MRGRGLVLGLTLLGAGCSFGGSPSEALMEPLLPGAGLPSLGDVEPPILTHLPDPLHRLGVRVHDVDLRLTRSGAASGDGQWVDLFAGTAPLDLFAGDGRQLAVTAIGLPEGRATHVRVVLGVDDELVRNGWPRPLSCPQCSSVGIVVRVDDFSEGLRHQAFLILDFPVDGALARNADGWSFTYTPQIQARLYGD